MERVEGIEPSHLAWQASRLPLHHTRMVPDDGYDPPQAFGCYHDLLPEYKYFY